jgi:hypothetical protein
MLETLLLSQSLDVMEEREAYHKMSSTEGNVRVYRCAVGGRRPCVRIPRAHAPRAGETRTPLCSQKRLSELDWLTAAKEEGSLRTVAMPARVQGSRRPAGWD